MQLREELGAKVMLARAVPAKWSLLGVNKKPELIEKRRKELEVKRAKFLHISGLPRCVAL